MNMHRHLVLSVARAMSEVLGSDRKVDVMTSSKELPLTPKLVAREDIEWVTDGTRSDLVDVHEQLSERRCRGRWRRLRKLAKLCPNERLRSDETSVESVPRAERHRRVELLPRCLAGSSCEHSEDEERERRCPQGEPGDAAREENRDRLAAPQTLPSIRAEQTSSANPKCAARLRVAAKQTVTVQRPRVTTVRTAVELRALSLVVEIGESTNVRGRSRVHRLAVQVGDVSATKAGDTQRVETR